MGVALVVGAVVALAPPVAAQPSCPRVVVYTLPAVTWHDIARHRPPALLQAIEDGAAASVSVRTNSARTTYASGFATIGAGSRVDGGRRSGGPEEITPLPAGQVLERDVQVSGRDEIGELAAAAGYDAIAGALASALERVPVLAIGNADLSPSPPTPLGRDRWPLVAAMDSTGRVEFAATGSHMIDASRPGPLFTDEDVLARSIDAALSLDCSVTVVDHGDLIRADQALVRGEEDVWAEALSAADAGLARVMAELDPARDLLLVVSPSSPAWDRTVHFGIAVAVGPGFEPGATLSSASTRRSGIVTLPDVAPTVLRHVGVERPAVMTGRRWVAEPAAVDRLTAALELDDESTFVDRVRAPIWTGFVILELLVYGGIALSLWKRRGRLPSVPEPVLTASVLILLAFPVATFLVGGVSGHALTVPGFVALLITTTVAVVAAAWVLGRDARGRLLAIVALTAAVLLGDLLLGSRLQLNTVFSYSPIVAGRFSGIGNIGFAVLGAAVILTAALAVDRWGRRPAVVALVAALFGATIVIDGAPSFGSDVGGVLAMVPALGLTWLFLAGFRPRWWMVLLTAAGTVAALGAFLVWDLSLPDESQTHLGRFFEDIRARGMDYFGDTIARKIRANLRVFTSTIWTYLVPPLLFFVGWLLFRPPGRWRAVQARFPAIRAGVVGGLILSVLGFALNDSGIVVPAVILSMLVPVALVVHLLIERETT